MSSPEQRTTPEQADVRGTVAVPVAPDDALGQIQPRALGAVRDARTLTGADGRCSGGRRAGCRGARPGALRRRTVLRCLRAPSLLTRCRHRAAAAAAATAAAAAAAVKCLPLHDQARKVRQGLGCRDDRILPARTFPGDPRAPARRPHIVRTLLPSSPAACTNFTMLPQTKPFLEV